MFDSFRKKPKPLITDEPWQGYGGGAPLPESPHEAEAERRPANAGYAALLRECESVERGLRSVARGGRAAGDEMAAMLVDRQADRLADAIASAKESAA